MVDNSKKPQPIIFDGRKKYSHHSKIVFHDFPDSYFFFSLIAKGCRPSFRKKIIDFPHIHIHTEEKC